MSTPGSSPSKNLQNRQESSQKEKEDINAFFSKLEVGDLCFLEIMEYGLALFGETKAGKTTLAHYLIQNPLYGTNELSYELKGGTKFKEAIIGHQPVSQTQIPNEIVRKVKGSKVDDKEIDMHILDCPGYSDSKGCFMVVANGYFHYRIFSKVKNLKFVITFDYKQFSGVFDKPKNTLEEFMMSFRNIKMIRKDIINATSFVFTKLDRFGQNDETIYANINHKLQALRDCGNINMSEYKEDIQQLINAVLENKRYFFFQKAQEGIPAKTDNKLLQEIHERTFFWSRKIIQSENEVDLTHIAMTLGERTQTLANNHKKFKHDFGVLTSEFKNRFERALLSRYNKLRYNPQCSLERITVEFLTNSILGSQKQRSFFTDYILAFLKVFNIYKTNAFNSKKQYEDKRTKIQASLSKSQKSIDSANIESIQKLEISKMIIELAQNKKYAFGGVLADQRSLQGFKHLSSQVIGFLSQLRKIRFFKDSQKEKGEYTKKLDEFNYIVYRLFEEAKTFKIIFATALDKERDTNTFATTNLDTTMVLFDYVQSISGQNYGFSFRDADAFEKCKLNYLTNHLEISSNEPDYYYTQIEEYFSNIKSNKDILQESAGKKLRELGLIKLNSNKFKADKNERVITYVNACKNLLNSIQNGGCVGEEYEISIQLYLESINKLAAQLSKIDKENKEEAKKSLLYAIKLFDSTSNVKRVIQSYQFLISKLQGLQLKDTLVKLADYASRHGRVQLAIDTYQHAYSAIEDAYDSKKDGFHTLRKQARETIANKIGMLGVEKKHGPSVGYFDALLKKKLFQLIDIAFLEEIGKNFGKKNK